MDDPIISARRMIDKLSDLKIIQQYNSSIQFILTHKYTCFKTTRFGQSGIKKIEF